MKKYFAAIITLIVLQLVLLFGSLALTINLRSDCSYIHGQFAMWQCTGNADPAVLPYAVFIVVPPILTKLFLDKLKQKISWKKIIALHAVVAMVVWLALMLLDTPHCGCGG